jgi:Transposase and inactivated derivatives
MQTQKKELSFKGENIYVGIDVHAKSWTITTAGTYMIYKNIVMPPEPEKLKHYLEVNFPEANYYSAYEAGFCGLWIHYRLQALGINNIVINPADIPTTQKEIAQKEDLRDSRKIAKSLRGGFLNGIYILQEDTLSERAILRFRYQLIKDLNRCKCRLKSFLYFSGIKYPDQFMKANSHWSRKFILWIESIPMRDIASKIVLNSLLTEVNNLRDQLLNTNMDIKHLSQTSKYKAHVELLQGIPGLGITTIMTLLTELEDINRFPNFDSFCSFIGLIPSTCSSGETDRNRGITFRGHRLRKSIIECAWITVRNDSALSINFINYSKRMAPNKAIIRIARKLLGRIYSVLKNKEPYQIRRIA